MVSLVGASMSSIVQAIPAVLSRSGRPVIVIGGVAVMCRLARPYRATADLDTVSRRRDDEAAQLELLLASGAELSGVAGALVPTPSGPACCRTPGLRPARHR